tara:strand:- start:48 stop:302 length:255 start_codon:yes stop_codon:yes gene_type:complete
MKYIKKGVAVNAVCYTGKNPKAVYNLVHDVCALYKRNDTLYVEMPHKDFAVKEGDYVIREMKNKIYSCSATIFESTYDYIETND